MAACRFHSRLSPEEAKRRILAASVRWGEDGLIAQACFGRIVAHWHVAYTKGGGPIFVGRLTTTATGSALVGAVRPHRGVQAFLALWFGALAAVTVLLYASYLGCIEGADTAHPAAGLLPIAMAGVAMGMLRLLKRCTRKHEDHIVKALGAAVEAYGIHR
jgi:hypothetical protein